MGKWRTLIARLSAFESLLSLAQRFGLTKFFSAVVGIIAGLLYAIAVRVFNNLPWWACLLIGLGVFALLALIAEAATRAWANAKTASAPQEVDRLALAERADQLSKAVLALYGRHAGAMQIAWDAMAARSDRDKGEYSKAQAALVEAYSNQFAGDVWSVIHTAERIGNIPREVVGDAWGLGGVPLSAYMVPVAGEYLSRLSVYLKYGVRNDE